MHQGEKIVKILTYQRPPTLPVTIFCGVSTSRKSMDFGFNCLGLNPRFSEGTQKNYLTSQCLSFFIYKLRVITDFHCEDIKCLRQGLAHSICCINVKHCTYYVRTHKCYQHLKYFFISNQIPKRLYWWSFPSALPQGACFCHTEVAISKTSSYASVVIGTSSFVFSLLYEC